METTTVNNLRKGDVLTTGEVIKSSCRMSMLNKYKSMGASYTKSHCEVIFEGAERPVFWHAGTVLNVKR